MNLLVNLESKAVKESAKYISTDISMYLTVYYTNEGVKVKQHYTNSDGSYLLECYIFDNVVYFDTVVNYINNHKTNDIVTHTTDWLKVYDDDSLVTKVEGDKIVFVAFKDRPSIYILKK